jgi:hypothetical protein
MIGADPPYDQAHGLHENHLLIDSPKLLMEHSTMKGLFTLGVIILSSRFFLNPLCAAEISGAMKQGVLSQGIRKGALRCDKHPSTWEEALLVQERKQWPKAADTQPSINLAGVYLFNDPPAGKTCYQYVWQECLELTITGGCIDNASGAVVSGGPVHHYVLNNAYEHADEFGKDKCSEPTNGNCYAALGPTLNRSLIVSTTKDWCETYGAENAVMLVGQLLTGEGSGPGAVGWNAVRAVSSDGSLVFVQNPNAAESGAQEVTVMRRASDQGIQCNHQGFDPKNSYCKKRSYQDASWSYTPACCYANQDLTAYTKFMDTDLYPSRDVQPFPNGPNIVSCDGSSPARRY